MAVLLLCRWFLAVVACFVLYPVIYILWNGPDATFGYSGGIVVMLLLQFLSPFHLWKYGLVAGTVLGLVWHLVAIRHHRSND